MVIVEVQAAADQKMAAQAVLEQPIKVTKAAIRLTVHTELEAAAQVRKVQMLQQLELVQPAELVLRQVFQEVLLHTPAAAVEVVIPAIQTRPAVQAAAVKVA
jgi:hypothetical protein